MRAAQIRADMWSGEQKLPQPTGDASGGGVLYIFSSIEQSPHASLSPARRTVSLPWEYMRGKEED